MLLYDRETRPTLMPPPKPPLPVVIILLFQAVGRNIAKLNIELSEEGTLMEMPHSSGKFVAFIGNSGLGSKVELPAGKFCTQLIEASPGWPWA